MARHQVEESEVQTSTLGRPIRVVIGKLALDAHNRGFNYVTLRLRDAGMEVIPMRIDFAEQLAVVAEQEDADVIGLSILTGAHLTIVGDLMEAARERGLDDVTFLVGGIVPDEDFSKLEELGVDHVFPAKTSDTGVIISAVRESVVRKRGGGG